MKRGIVGLWFAALWAAVAVGQTASPTTAPTTRHALIAEKGEPVVAIWEGGIHLLGTESRVVVAAWADGTVVREVAHRMLPGVPIHDTNGRTVGGRIPIAQEFRIGRVEPAAVRAIVDAADRAGVGALPPVGGIAPDGPFEVFVIWRDGAAYARSHDGRSRRGRSAYPNLDGYDALWRTAVDPLRALAPADERPLDGPIGLGLPRATR